MLSLEVQTLLWFLKNLLCQIKTRSDFCLISLLVSARFLYSLVLLLQETQKLVEQSCCVPHPDFFVFI